MSDQAPGGGCPGGRTAITSSVSPTPPSLPSTTSTTTTSPTEMVWMEYYSMLGAHGFNRGLLEEGGGT